MARSRNFVELIGNLGNDPDVKYTQANKPVTRISVATSEQWKDNDGNPRERTEWHRVVFFGKLAEIAAEYLKKGSQVFIEGKLRYEKVSTDDGDRYYTDIVADELIMFNAAGGERRERSDDDRQYDERRDTRSNNSGGGRSSNSRQNTTQRSSRSEDGNRGHRSRENYEHALERDDGIPF
ncbi:single-stranded DNA-binding protein [Luteimonas sp. MHLX1A]|uniref:single-stranded DNA-binding protein n=1 Tax=Alterluteimonas muca TaxID=2878684 RepID=UPI001E3ED88B|nr:single-stranded DNA-binding protein [Luteimonas sp. MHLX1A]MCD9046723.1 single-stranded DNA-binding protein [Luteimonas sp. MHLX1A]